MTQKARQIGETLLKVEGVNLSFGGIKALNDVSFEIREREILAIIGPNGAGKSSMLNVINGFYHPQEGTITYRAMFWKVRAMPDLAAACGFICLRVLPL